MQDNKTVTVNVTFTAEEWNYILGSINTRLFERGSSKDISEDGSKLIFGKFQRRLLKKLGLHDDDITEFLKHYEWEEERSPENEWQFPPKTREQQIKLLRSRK